MVLLIDTTESHIGNAVLQEIEKSNLQNYELIDTTDMNISHCIGCNYCWLKTPGICTIKDDYRQILGSFITGKRRMHI